MAQKKKVPVKAAARAKAAKADVTTPKKKAAAPKSAVKATSKSATRTKKPATSTAARKSTTTAKTAAAKKPAAAKKVAAKAAKPAAKKPAAKKPAAPAKKAAARPTAKATAAAQRTTTARKAPATAKKPSAAPRPAAKIKVKAVAASAAKPPVKRQPANEGAKPISKAAAGAHAKHIEVAPKASAPKPNFKTGEFIVYPAHGVGEIIAIEEQEIAGMTLELYVITFEKDKMTLRVPTAKLESVGMRKLASNDVVEKALTTLKGRARVKRTMWSRRAQEYEQKINSGDLIAIAEVVRDLYRSDTQPEQSYSERQLYEAALDRMARELSAVEDLDERGANQRITDVLSKSAKGRRLAEEAAAQEGEANADNSKAA